MATIQRPERSTIKILRYLLSIFLLALLALTAVFAFQWRYYHDSPILFYVSFLIDKFGMVPYRDIFEYNMPGTYLAFLLIGRLTGYSILGVRLLDYMLLAVIIFLGWLWMRKLSGWAGFFGAVAFGLVYLSLGPTAMLQREYLTLIPILCGLAAYTNLPSQRNGLRLFITGLFFGMASTMKPQAFVGLLPVLVMEWYSAIAEPALSQRKRFTVFLRRIVFWAIIGFLIPWTVTLVYLAIHGALPRFLEIVFTYLPLFANLNGNHQAVYGIRRIFSLVTEYSKLGGYGLWIAPALLGTHLLQHSPDIPSEKKRRGVFLVLLIIAYSIYPVFSGQFFPQHWLLFAFLLFQASFLCLAVKVDSEGGRLRWLPAAVFLVASVSLMRPDTLDNLRLLIVERELPAANNPNEGRVDEMAAFLETHLRPGDTVQPLDWVGGAVHAMLIAKVKIATPFIVDEYFYHDLNVPYVLQLRTRFINDLQHSMPRFVIDVYDDGAYSEPTGPNTSRDFPELRAFLAENYSVVKEGQGYRIYELRTK